MSKVVRLTDQEWEILRRVRDREELTARVLAKEAEARSARQLAMERLRMKEAEVEAIRADLAELEAREAAEIPA